MKNRLTKAGRLVALLAAGMLTPVAATLLALSSGSPVWTQSFGLLGALQAAKLLSSSHLVSRVAALVALLLGLEGRGSGRRVVADHVELLAHRPQVRGRPVDQDADREGDTTDSEDDRQHVEQHLLLLGVLTGQSVGGHVLGHQLALGEERRRGHREHQDEGDAHDGAVGVVDPPAVVPERPRQRDRAEHLADDRRLARIEEVNRIVEVLTSIGVVAVSASPSRVPSSGGTVTIIASAVDAAGNTSDIVTYAWVVEHVYDTVPPVVVLAVNGELGSSASLEVGDEVAHGTFGEGMVMSIDGDRAEVDFAGHGTRTIRIEFLRAVGGSQIFVRVNPLDSADNERDQQNQEDGGKARTRHRRAVATYRVPPNSTSPHCACARE